MMLQDTPRAQTCTVQPGKHSGFNPSNACQNAYTLT